MQSPWTSSSCLAWRSCISAGDEVYLCADITDIAEGATATIKIVEKDADGKDDNVATLSASVSDGRIKCQWQVTYTADEDDADSQKELAEKGYTLPEYAFVVECGGATSGESRHMKVKRALSKAIVPSLNMPVPGISQAGKFQPKGKHRWQNTRWRAGGCVELPPGGQVAAAVGRPGESWDRYQRRCGGHR